MNGSGSPLAVVAIGGNSLIKDKNHPEVAHQWDAIRETVGHIARMIDRGWRTVITHGNGPQVGFILRRNELAAGAVHTTPLSLIVADTQGSIGYMLQQGLSNEFYQRNIPRQTVTLVTQVQVDADDPAFQNPTKPIGGFLEEEVARQFEEVGWRIVEDAGRGWRRVIASPRPQEIIELEAIRSVVEMGWVVIACGGGGIPVVRNSVGELRGVSAVVDKDLASSFLASRLGADLLLISTGVAKVALDYGRPNQQDLSLITESEARKYRNEGHFAVGSMLPKIDACLEFLEQSSSPTAACLITNPENLLDALAGKTGTRIVRDDAPARTQI